MLIPATRCRSLILIEGRERQINTWLQISEACSIDFQLYALKADVKD
jgi:hypothetical protein